ncbi:30S ribosomal protein S3 [Xylocopilactobacillus apis]|uniref:Small ribosomal subunit protein uS3 n=1 Tax=Xylocopilactobacillus apis TaxID=2932183 RepID=A0AAU9D0R7_9LACO|nr:30S ribosomal protein S3 [Xylocopilactobacillus apis]BDR57264.1 30S ribosomal protein S3 [Xylocopilactobacillus apis]
MGQKINPIGFRVGVIRDYEDKWYAEKDFAKYLIEDIELRKYIFKRLASASVSHVEIERASNMVNVFIHTAKPGMVIGKGGSEVEILRHDLSNLTKSTVHVNIVEIKKPDLDAHLVGESIASQLEARIAFRRAQRQAMQRVMRAGALGVKTQISGRLNGADMARREKHSLGSVPLHTLRADIDYSWDEAITTYGKLGVKTWIYRGEVLPGKPRVNLAEEGRPQRGNQRRGGNRGNNRNNNRSNNRNNRRSNNNGR